MTGADSRIVRHGLLRSFRTARQSLGEHVGHPAITVARMACERDDLPFDPRLRGDEEGTPPCRGGHREPQRHHDQQAQTCNCSREGFCVGESDVMWQITCGWSL